MTGVQTCALPILGQELPPASFDRLLELARRRWREFGHSPAVRIETLTFVRQRADGSWMDLSEMGLGRVPAVG